MKTELTETIKTDVLIVGGGAAGVAAAIEAAKYGVDVVLIDKGKVGFSGSASTSGAGTSAVFLAEDSAEKFLNETIDGGEQLNFKELTETLVKEGNQAIRKLDIFGVPYKHDSNGEFKLYIQLGQKLPRTPSVDGGGPAYMLALRKEALHREVKFYESMMVIELIKRENTVIGCLAIERENGKICLFTSKAIVLAAGSATDLYPYTTASYKTTGDGYWLGWNAGLEFINMEFIEFSVMPAPNGIPLSSGGIKPLTARGAKFYNVLGERFMEKYEPEKKELTKRGRLVYCIYKEISEGRGPVYMDATEISEDDYYTLEQIEKRGILIRLRECGINYKKDKFQWVSPAVHGFLGGIKIDKNCKTSINGLYVAGENAGGVYGADRVGSFLTACAVFGFKAGMNAAKTALKKSQNEIPWPIVNSQLGQIKNISKERQGERSKNVLKKIKEIAGKYIACERDANGLKEAIKQLKHTMESGIYKIQIKNIDDFIRVLEIRNLCLTGMLVANAALLREETRGQHRRIEYPERDKLWLKHILLKKDNDNINLTTKLIN